MRIILSNNTKHQVLALGAQSKGGFCFVKDGIAYCSKPCGDLSDLENFRLFERRIEGLKRRLRLDPEIIACDLHPEYISTKFAFGLVAHNSHRLTQVQHHEAHLASCIADNKVKGEVIGVVFDGTGFGLDGNIWGGEFFVGTIRRFKRVAHLQYVPMPGGEASVREPWRMALSYLYSTYGKNIKDLKIDFMSRLNKEKMGLLIQIIDKKINTPLASSIGRLFDAVSALIGLCNFTRYEGEPAIELEKKISLVKSFPRLRSPRCQAPRYQAPRREAGQVRFKVESYRFNIIRNKEVFIVLPDGLIKNVVKDLKNKVPAGIISLRFHNAICDMIKDVCNLLRKRYKINKVSLSGGVFQNRYLTNQVRPLLEKEGFKVYLHQNLPTHDGNIALGQAVIASAQGDMSIQG